MIIINNASYSNVSVTYTADGTQREFSFPFDYLRKAFVKVEVNEEIILVQGTDYTVSDNKTVVLTEAPESGTIVRVFRETSTTRLVSWADASVLRAKDMTIQQVQNLHILEEQQYWVTENAIIRQGKEWNARNFPIKNVGDPVDSKDATNKEYVDNNFMKLDDNGNYWVGRGKTIRDIEEPIRQSDGATKNYVDHVLAGLSITGDRVQTFNSVALMKESHLEPGMVAMTTGYHNPNDGGAGVYNIRAKLVSDVEDGGSIIFLDNGNVAELIIDSKINVKNFGAKGDAVTDDTTAIQNAINFAHNKAVNYVLFPKGTYLCTSSLTLYHDITLGSDVIAQDYGGNVHGVTIRFDGVSYGIDITNISYVSFENLTFDGNNTSEVLVRGGFVTKALHCNFRGATVAGFAFSGDVMTTYFEQCSFSKNYDGVITDANLTSITTVSFNNCWLRENNNCGYKGKTKDVLFHECVFESNYSHGVNSTGGWLAFEHCWFEQNDVEQNLTDAYKGFHVNSDNITNGYFFDCEFGSTHSIKPLYSSNLTGQILFENCKHAGLGGLSPVFSDSTGTILFKNSFGDLAARGFYNNHQKWYDVTNVDYREGQEIWMLVDHPDYIDVTFNPELYTYPSTIHVTPNCVNKMVVGVSNVTRRGFRIQIYEKPTGANASIYWTANSRNFTNSNS